MMETELFSIKGLSKSIDGTNILSNIDIDINKKEIVSLIGPSGSGKTTLLKCMAGLLPIDSGEVRFKGKIISQDEKKYKSIYPKITAVTQGFTLWPHLTNLENITISKHSISKEKIDYYSELLGVHNLLKKYPYECSGGEQQRISLLRHIALNPDILLLDEITSALDVEQIDIISKLLIQLKNNGMGIFIITHLISFASKGDVFYFLDKGVIKEFGNSNQLLSPQTKRMKKFLSVYSI